MSISLGAHRYGKAETRVVSVTRNGDRHDLKDLNVSVALAGDLAASYLHGDNADVLPTDTQKNTVYAFAREYGIGAVEDFALRLARHFVDSQPAIRWARVSAAEYAWERIAVDGGPAPHSFARAGRETRLASVTDDGSRTWVVSGLTDLLLLNSTGSEFRGFPRDRYTTLPESSDRVLATAVDARWRHASPPPRAEPGEPAAEPTAEPPGKPAGEPVSPRAGRPDEGWDRSYQEVRRHLLAAFAETYSNSLQHTLYAMGRRVLEHCPEIAEIRLTLPNRHHLLVDLAPFGLSNDNEVYVAADRPYGLIEGTVLRDGAPAGEDAW
jgi:urate oxidase